MGIYTPVIFEVKSRIANVQTPINAFKNSVLNGFLVIMKSITIEIKKTDRIKIRTFL